MVHELKDFDVNVYGYDPLLSDTVIKRFGTKPLPKLDRKMDAVIIAEAHRQFRDMKFEKIRALFNHKPVLIDVRRMIDRTMVEKSGSYCRKL